MNPTVFLEVPMKLSLKLLELLRLLVGCQVWLWWSPDSPIFATALYYRRKFRSKRSC